jgi:hypothetical protein
MKRILLVWLLSFVPLPSFASQDGRGQVQIPLDIYNQLIESTRTPVSRAPLNFALGSALVNVRVASMEPRPIAEVSVTLPIEIFENEWALVPVLPPGTPVTRAAVQGNPVQLVATPSGLCYGTNVKGAYVMELAYQVDAASTGRGYVLALPLPQASSVQLGAVLPGTGLDVSVLPAAGARTTESGSQTTVQATVPSTSGVQIAWRAPSEKGPALSRSLYRGELSQGSVRWSAEFHVELFSTETATVPFLPGSITLTSLSVDGREAPILVAGGRFATLLRGQGSHKIVAAFHTPVIQENGPARTELHMPRAPVSRIDLVLPGRKDVSASPAATVTTRLRGAFTEATVHVPLTEKVTLSWSEAIPEAARRELRASASIYHVLHAEEGVLYARAHVVYEVQNGATNRIELALPRGVEVNEVTSKANAVADWRVEPGREGRRVLRVFLDRDLTTELALTVDYDRSLGTSGAETLPLLSALSVGRQRGMVALVSSRDRALSPIETASATAVGENQLPSFVRDEIKKTIAHTLKYSDAPPSIEVTASVPERTAGRFDAEVDTLVTLGDVTLLSSASIEIHVKSGGVERLSLALPVGASLLHLVAPSLRTHRVVDGVVEVEFTQEMEGDFRIEASYERLLGENEAEVEAPTMRVRGAEVEQGRIAVEATSALEVAPLAIEALSPLDVRELPRQLVLRTSHPILHAFRYVRAEPAPRLSLAVTRHALAAVQEAVIDRAEHRTLFTKDGLAVTTSSFVVRNTRKQFLRLQLPEGSEIWSVFVAGKAEKPAIAAAAEAEAPAFLIKIVSSSERFPVELVYATKVPPIAGLGSLRASLPRPDLLVTESRFDLYLPGGFDYRRPSTNMSLVIDEGRISGDALAREMSAAVDAAESGGVPDPFRIQVPSAGIHYAFEKLYANHSGPEGAEAYVSIPYASRAGALVGQMVSLFGVFVAFLAIRLWVGKDERFAKRTKIAAGAFGALITLAAVGVYGVSPVPAFVLAIALAGLSGRQELRRFFERRRPAKPAEQNV